MSETSRMRWWQVGFERRTPKPESLDCAIGRREIGQRSRRSFGVCGPTRAIVVLLAGWFLLQASVRAQVKEIRRVLMFNDFGTIASPGFREMDEAIFTGLQKSPYQ